MCVKKPPGKVTILIQNMFYFILIIKQYFEGVRAQNKKKYAYILIIYSVFQQGLKVGFIMF